MEAGRDLQPMAKRFYTSMTRISDLEQVPFEMRPLPREAWDTGDYVVCEARGGGGPLHRVELPSGRRTPVMSGDEIVGALGARAATHECSGDWRQIGPDLVCQQFTGAGLIGKVASNSPWAGAPLDLVYLGHAVRDDKLTMRQFVRPVRATAFDRPVILVTGTSMSVGKTLTARALVHALAGRRLNIAGVKLAGAAGYKDVLALADAGAAHVLDYVDAGIPSTVCTEAEYRDALDYVLAKVQSLRPDVLVVEIGASPYEPYNGWIALERLLPHCRLHVLCAADAYAARGMVSMLSEPPDVVAGPAANTAPARDLVHAFTGLACLDVRDRAAVERLVLAAALGRDIGAAK